MRNRSSFKNGGAGYKNRYKLFSLLLAFILVTVFMPKTEVMAANTLGNSGVTPAIGDYKDFAYTGGVQSFTAPVNGIYKMEVWGGSGGCDYNGGTKYGGGNGGYSVGYRKMDKGTTIYIAVGGEGDECPYASDSYIAGGWNGGGGSVQNMYNSWDGAGGGGATHIATTNRGVLSNYESYRGEVLIVAGGGGGGRTGSYYSHREPQGYAFYGGSGGGTNGGGSWGIQKDGDESWKSYSAADGGTQSSGYKFGQGATSAGGGWYGGRCSIEDYEKGSGGGSGYIGGVPSITWAGTTYSPSTSNGVNSGNGKARITLVMPTYYITYDKNVTNSSTTASPTVSNMPTPNPEYYTGSESVGTFTVKGNPTRAGYTFNGWNTKSNGTGTSHVKGDTITLKAN